MAAIAEQMADLVMVTSDNPRTEDPQEIIRQIMAGFAGPDPKRVTVEPDRKKAIEMVKGVVEEAEVGKVYKGKVVKIAEFGAFVEVSPAISGLVHVSEIANEFVKDPHRYLKEGQEVEVKVIGIDEQGRVKMSIKQVGHSPAGRDFGRKPFFKKRESR